MATQNFDSEASTTNTLPPTQTPIPIKILTMLLYIASFLEIVTAGLLGIMGTYYLHNLTLPLPKQGNLLLSLLILGFGVVSFIIARGVSHRKNWARLLVVFCSALSILISLVFIATNPNLWALQIIPIIINTLLAGYLLSSKIRTYFKINNEKILTPQFITLVIIIVVLITGSQGIRKLIDKQASTSLDQAIKLVAPASTDDCGATSYEFLRNHCYINLAASTNDFTYCDKISGETAETDKANCYGLQAASARDLLACTKATDVQLCISASTLHFGKYTKDPAACNIYTQIDAGLLNALRQQEKSRNIPNLSSNFEGETLVVIENDWRKECLENMGEKSTLER